MALKQGFAPDPDLQLRALNHFANDLLVRSYPPFRVIFSATDLQRLGDGLRAHPLQFVLQLFLEGTTLMLKAAGPQPRGPAAKAAPIAAIMRMLVCLADEVFSRDPGTFQRVQRLAHQAGYGTEATLVTKLEAIYFLVADQMKQTWGYNVGAVHEYDRDFARTYLYPYKDQYRPLVARCLEVPGVWQRLLGLQ